MAEQAAQDNKITFKGKEYYIKDMSNEALRYVEQIVDLEKKIYSTGMELDRYQIANEYFYDKLGRELEPESDL